jgi:hypothetical protein
MNDGALPRANRQDHPRRHGILQSNGTMLWNDNNPIF